ncbi:hypothetical protein C4D60_Mb07t01740 [Musa balbisiana]|uniref:Cystatin domain-containing protein n=1 Tax=Musa balbisiana TaxID=52838 RepID=A0A4S8JC89_MUSBA|nr:hypothetical protein C4D60_Mb07t01740 [Musa balbisiana]
MLRRWEGGWKPIGDLDEPHIHDIVVFAISDHKQETKEHLTWDKVVKGETQLVSGLGLQYKLLVMTKNEMDVSARHEAVVWEKEWMNFRKLVSFDLLVITSLKEMSFRKFFSSHTTGVSYPADVPISYLATGSSLHDIPTTTLANVGCFFVSLLCYSNVTDVGVVDVRDGLRLLSMTSEQ